MRRRLAAILFVLGLTTLLAGAADPEAVDDPIILVFYEEGCSSCEIVEELIAQLAVDLPPSAIRRYEISQPGTLDLLDSLAGAFEVQTGTVPVVFVGDEAIVGAGRSAEFGLRAAIGDCAVQGCPSPLDRIRPPEFPWLDVLRLSAFAALVCVLVMLQPL